VNIVVDLLQLLAAEYLKYSSCLVFIE